MTHRDGLTRYVLAVAAVVLTVVALFFGRDLLILTILSALFAFLMLPMCRKLEKWGAPRWLGALLSTVFLILIVLGLFFLMGWQFSRFGRDLPELQTQLADKGQQLQAWIEDRVQISQREQVQWFNKQVSGLAQHGGTAAMAVFSTTGATLAVVVPIPIIVFLLLLLKDKFRIFFKEVSERSNGLLLEVMARISKLSYKYLRGVLLVVVILGVLNSIGFLILGLKYAILLGFLLGFLNIIPYVGVILGSIFPVIIALLTKDSAMYALGALGVCLGTQFLENNIITPKIVGSSVSINPLASILALIGFGMMWGVIGMVLAIPIMGMLKIVCDAIPALKPYGYLLGEEKDYPEEQLYRIPFLARRRPPVSPPSA